MMSYMSLGMGQPKEILRAEFIERMIQPAGRPPKTED